MSDGNVYPMWRIFNAEEISPPLPVRLHYMCDGSVSAGCIEQHPEKLKEDTPIRFRVITNQNPHIHTYVPTLGEAMTLIEWAYHEHTKERP
jgi:hypothetical protein